MAYDLSSQHITLTAQDMTHGIKSAVVNAQTRIEELKTGQDNLNDAVETALNNVDVRLNALLGGETVLSADVSKDGTTITVDGPSIVTKDAKLEIGDSDTVYTVVSKDENNVITLDPAIDADYAQGTVVNVHSAADVTAIQEQMNVLAEIFSKEGTANDVFDALVILANAWNEAGDMISVKEVEFTAENGEASVDLSAFNFQDTSYKLIGSVDGKGAMASRTGFIKVSKSEAKIVAYDTRYFVEDEVKYNASVDGASFIVTIGVTYPRPRLSFSITDEENNTTSVE